MHSVNNELVGYSQRLIGNYEHILTLEQMQENFAIDNRIEIGRACSVTALVTSSLAGAVIALASRSIFLFLGASFCYGILASSAGHVYGRKFDEIKPGKSFPIREGFDLVAIAGGAVLSPFLFVWFRKKIVETHLERSKALMIPLAVCWQNRAEKTELYKENLETIPAIEPFLTGSRTREDVTAFQKWFICLWAKTNEIKQAAQ